MWSLQKATKKQEDEPPDLVKNEYIPFDDKTRIQEILLGVDKNIEQLRISKKHLAAFIRKNCRHSELF